MSPGTRMEYGCPHCKGRFSQDLPQGAPKAQARYAVVLELHDPALAGQCIELHLHGWHDGEEIIQTVRFAVDPQSREVHGPGSAGVRITALYEKPPEWPVLCAIKGSALPGEYSARDRLIVDAYPHFIHEAPPYYEDGQEVAGERTVFIAPVPIAAMWTYAAPEGK